MSSDASALERLSTAIGELTESHLSGPDSEPLGAQLVELRSAIDRLEAEFLRRLEVFDRRGGGAASGAGSTTNWLRWRCRLGGRDAVGTVRTARRLADALPATTAALGAGEISRRHADVLSAASVDLPDEVVSSAEPTLLEAARRFDPDQLRRVAKHWRHTVDADRSLTNANAAHNRRYLHLSPVLDGLIAIDGLLDADAGASVLAAITALSAPLAGDTRSPAQRRADALAEIARRALEGGAMPESGGERPHVNVIVDLATLEARAGARAADMDWSGPVPGETARRLSCDAGLSRIVTNGASEVLDVGRRTRLIPAGIRRALHVRDGGCVFPGCDRPPPWTDAHHITHWVDGGSTSLDNLALLCRTHHRLVHESRWKLARTAEGSFTVNPPERSRSGAGAQPGPVIRPPTAADRCRADSEPPDPEPVDRKPQRPR